MSRLRTLGIVLGVVAVLLGAGLLALGRGAGVGPFAPGAPASWIYVAESRDGPDGVATDIEAIDLASGDRVPFSTPRRIFDLALSSDRRTLYASSGEGRVYLLDATRGTPLGEMRSSVNGEVTSIALAPGGRVLAVVVYGSTTSFVLFDPGERREVARLAIGRRLAGRPVVAGDARVPVIDVGGPAATASGRAVLTVSLDPLAVRDEVALPAAVPVPGGPAIAFLSAGTPPPSLARAADGSLLFLDPQAFRIDVVGTARGADLAAIYARGVRRLFIGAGFTGDVAVSPDGRVAHACLGGRGTPPAVFARAQRYRLTLDDLAPGVVGGDCGRFGRTADGRVVLALTERPELQVLDPASGAAERTLPLAGYAAATAG